MTLATYSKLAIASLVLLTLGVGSATIPVPGPSSAHGADDVFEIELAQSDTATASHAAVLVQPNVSAVNVVQPAKISSTRNPAANAFTVYANTTSSAANPKISKEASQGVIRALIEALDDNEQQVAHNAAKSLISLGKGKNEVVEAFANVVAHSRDRKLRYYSIFGLGRVGGDNPTAVRALTNILEQDSESVFRKAAVESLGQLKIGDEVAMTLASALKDSDAEVRGAAAKVLGRLNPMHNSVLGPQISLPSDFSSNSSSPANDLRLQGTRSLR